MSLTYAHGPDAPFLTYTQEEHCRFSHCIWRWLRSLEVRRKRYLFSSRTISAPAILEISYRSPEMHCVSEGRWWKLVSVLQEKATRHYKTVFLQWDLSGSIKVVISQSVIAPERSWAAGWARGLAIGTGVVERVDGRACVPGKPESARFRLDTSPLPKPKTTNLHASLSLTDIVCLCDRFPEKLITGRVKCSF